MSLPTLTPASTVSAIVLPITGAASEVNGLVPYKVYSDPTTSLYSVDFLSGATEQVAYVYKKLGGDILDIELTTGNIYSAYEEACLEYSYIINVHQASNVLSDALGNMTGTFDHKGEIKTGELSSSLGGSHVALKYPRFEYGTTRRVIEGISAEAGLGHSVEYSASFDVTPEKQDYDLQEIISSATGVPYQGNLAGRRVSIKRVFYKTPSAMWRFYGYYGGLNVVGNLSSYGQFSDASTFELVPTWHNKSQAMAFEDAIYTRTSHYSYELKDNKIRLFPQPMTGGPDKMWVQFSVPRDSFMTSSASDTTIDGINNLNTLPFGNLPYGNINSIGKQWIRRFALSLSKEMLGQVRSKFSTVPIPGESVTLNGSDLISQAREEQQLLREELKTTLSELTYARLAASDAEKVEATEKVVQRVPVNIFVG